MQVTAKLGNIINAIIPISRFNKGEASKIFEEVLEAGVKIVVKNNKPTCVLVAPDEYQKMLDEMEDYLLLKEAIQRISTNSPSTNISQEDLIKKLNISKEELAALEVEIE